MPVITLYSIGKTKERWLQEACEEYVLRLTPYAKIKSEWLQSDAQLLKAIASERLFICLDASGDQFTSIEFSAFLHEQIEKSGSRIAFVIGGPVGLPPVLRKHRPLISLSKMTFTHQCTRLILLEQIYRAFEIAKGSPYHK